VDPRDPAVPELLARGRIDVTGRLVDASNATLFGTVSADGSTAKNTRSTVCTNGSTTWMKSIPVSAV